MLISGDHGQVLHDATPLADITFWRFQTMARGITYASSATGGFRRQIVGARHGAGMFRFRVDLAAPIWSALAEGSLVTLKLHVDATRHYAVPAIVETLQIEVDVEQGQPIGGEATFATQGGWTTPD